MRNRNSPYSWVNFTTSVLLYFCLLFSFHFLVVVRVIFLLFNFLFLIIQLIIFFKHSNLSFIFFSNFFSSVFPNCYFCGNLPYFSGFCFLLSTFFFYILSICICFPFFTLFGLIYFNSFFSLLFLSNRFSSGLFTCCFLFSSFIPAIAVLYSFSLYIFIIFYTVIFISCHICTRMMEVSIKTFPHTKHFSYKKFSLIFS